jgi:anthranilate phosphoribosyltransferase
MLRKLEVTIKDGKHLSREQAVAAAESILNGSHSEDVVAQFLVALAEKGETADEIAGFASALLKRAVRIEAPPGAVDLCGTGGSGLPRFNVSTAAAFLVAACGVPVAKHGNKGSREPNGSFDLIEALGLPVELSPALARECLEKVGLAFLFARAYHPIMKHVVGARKKAGRRTIFNLVGPLCNPAGVTMQVIGTADRAKLEPIARALQMLGRKRALVVRGDPGIDEFSTAGVTDMWETTPGAIRHLSLTPEECGITRVSYDQVAGGNGAVNARVFHQMLDGRAPQSVQDMVALSAGGVLYVAERVRTIAEGCARAKRCIAEGGLRRKFEEYRRLVS